MDSETYRIPVEFSEEEIIRLIQILNKYIVETQRRDGMDTPFESQLMVKLLNERSAAILKAKASPPLPALNQV
jgi:hypothetical protein